MVKEGYQKISGYGIIGDTLTTALVGIDGSIDWFCIPRFDSPSVFAAVLDRRKGGNYRIWAEGTEKTEQGYDGFTNVLITTMHAAEGALRITDFMPVRETPGEDQEIHRIIKCTEGRVTVRLHCSPRPDYARARTEVEVEGGRCVFKSPEQEFVLLTNLKPEPGDGEIYASFELVAGEEEHFVFKESTAEDPGDLVGHCRMELDNTMDFWDKWSNRCAYKGEWEDSIKRSALVLKLLTYSPTGAILAAPTTSLPEEIGGERNWDYRFSWLRDAALTLYTLSSLGYEEEHQAYLGWIRRLCAVCGVNLQVLFGIEGARDLRESTLDHLEGYRESRPVRIGNGAFDQFQLDIYGEVVNAINHHLEQGGSFEEDIMLLMVELVDFVADNWSRPDNGIWEVRGGERHFLYSKLMSWVALDRGLKIAKGYDFLDIEPNVEGWEKARSELEKNIIDKGWDEEKGSLVMYYGTDGLDAAVLNYPLMGFFSPDDPRVRSMVERIEEELRAGNLVRRYMLPDGLSGGEGAFVLCSFWLAGCWTLLGEKEKAAEIIDAMCDMSNHLQLFSEEIDVGSGAFLGNFPQAFSHIGLINSVLNYRTHFPS